MKIAIIGDVHGNYNALKIVLEDMEQNNIDSVIVLGDTIFMGNDPQKCFDTIKELKPIVWIKGNTDDWFNEIDDNFHPKDEKEDRLYKEYIRVNKIISQEVRDTMKVLKEKEMVEIEGKKILCVHGSDRSINEPIGIMTSKEELGDLIDRLKCDILLCAHTHLPYAVTFDCKVIMNVGSVGLPYDEPKAAYGILNFDRNAFEYSIRRINLNKADNQ